MVKVFMFGGPGLPEGTHTYYADKTKKYSSGALMEFRADPGDRVPADSLDRIEVFIERGLGAVIEEKKTPIEA